ncbi:MAG: DmsE family decaheme c-type cytochrome [Ketobacteraceae bacterium]|nr:DmsE family decaheme c-type cytochrome [Ketobacteraceae bacterium]
MRAERGITLAGALARSVIIGSVVVVLLAVALLSGVASAGEDYADGGTDTCLACHEGMHESAMNGLKQSPHGVLFYQADSRKTACESCHGPGADHARKPKAVSPPMLLRKGKEPAGEVNQSCLSCHKDSELTHWHTGAHQSAELSCVSCHSIHETAANKLEGKASNDLCMDCHTQQRAQSHMPSTHPITEGVTNCIDCHNPHGSLARAQLKQPTLNDNCYSCHAEKRGPMLFEHAPVTEDCSTCHQVHGSVHQPLLNSRPPFLCQQCHMAAGHVSIAQSGSNLSGNASMLGKNCMNCHSEVHGSNHPSGARLTR